MIDNKSEPGAWAREIAQRPAMHRPVTHELGHSGKVNRHKLPDDHKLTTPQRKHVTNGG